MGQARLAQEIRASGIRRPFVSDDVLWVQKVDRHITKHESGRTMFVPAAVSTHDSLLCERVEVQPGTALQKAKPRR